MYHRIRYDSLGSLVFSVSISTESVDSNLNGEEKTCIACFLLLKELSYLVSNAVAFSLAL